MTTVHTSDLDHAILAAVHSDAPHADSVWVRAVEHAEDGAPTRYRAEVTINRSGEGGTAVEALAVARTRLRAAMGAEEAQQRQRAEQAVAERDQWIARTVKAEDRLDGAAWDELTYERDRLRGEAGALAELVQQLARRAEKAETALADLTAVGVSDV